MKRLSQFNKFDCDAFFRDKVLKVTNVRPWRDFNTKEILGTEAEVIIIKDATVYKTSDGEQVSNMYEKLKIKIRRMNAQVPIGACITLVNPEAVVYGDYRNQLSVKCDNINILQSKN